MVRQCRLRQCKSGDGSVEYENGVFYESLKNRVRMRDDEKCRAVK